MTEENNQKPDLKETLSQNAEFFQKEDKGVTGFDSFMEYLGQTMPQEINPEGFKSYLQKNQRDDNINMTAESMRTMARRFESMGLVQLYKTNKESSKILFKNWIKTQLPTSPTHNQPKRQTRKPLIPKKTKFRVTREITGKEVLRKKKKPEKQRITESKPQQQRGLEAQQKEAQKRPSFSRESEKKQLARRSQARKKRRSGGSRIARKTIGYAGAGLVAALMSGSGTSAHAADFISSFL